MTIQELIDKLKQFPPAATVHVVNKWGNWQKIIEVVPNDTPPKATAVCLRGGSHV